MNAGSCANDAQERSHIRPRRRFHLSLCPGQFCPSCDQGIGIAFNPGAAAVVGWLTSLGMTGASLDPAADVLERRDAVLDRHRDARLCRPNRKTHAELGVAAPDCAVAKAAELKFADRSSLRRVCGFQPVGRLGDL